MIAAVIRNENNNTKLTLRFGKDEPEARQDRNKTFE